MAGGDGRDGVVGKEQAGRVARLLGSGVGLDRGGDVGGHGGGSDAAGRGGEALVLRHRSPPERSEGD